MDEWLYLFLKVVVSPAGLHTTVLAAFYVTILPEQSRAVGRSENPGGHCVEMGFYVDISWESRCNTEINV